MFKSKAQAIQDILFGKSSIEGGTPVRAQFQFPLQNGGNKYFYWKGNEGLIFTLIEKIEKLEEEVSLLKSKKSK